MDDADIAQAATEVLEDAALRAHLARTNTIEAVRGSLHRSSSETTPSPCQDCGQPIPKGRLKANPAATRCVKCQERHELKARADR